MGTAPFMPPEMLKGDRYGPLVDMWSLGVLTYCLLFAQLPYSAKQKDQVLSPDITKSLLDFAQNMNQSLQQQQQQPQRPAQPPGQQQQSRPGLPSPPALPQQPAGWKERSACMPALPQRPADWKERIACMPALPPQPAGWKEILQTTNVALRANFALEALKWCSAVFI